MKIEKPKTPKGYRLLKDGVDKTSETDFVWAMAYDDLCHEWTSAKYLDRLNGEIYHEHKDLSDWYQFRCRKIS